MNHSVTSYDPSNIFAKILRKEVDTTPLFEDEFALAFKDINPLAPVHVLVIPKGPYRSPIAFMAQASDKEITGFWRAVKKVVTLLKLDDKGVRFIMNDGQDGGQEVAHFHVHLLAGRPIGPMVSPSKS